MLKISEQRNLRSIKRIKRVICLNKSILVLKGENKLNPFLDTLKYQKQSMLSLPAILSDKKFVFSDGEDEINVQDYHLVVLLSNPNDRIWKIILKAEKLRIPTINSSNLILKYNDCLQTQLDLESWGIRIPKLGKTGIRKERCHEKRKNGKTSIFPQTSINPLESEKYYYEQYIEGELFKVKILGMKKAFVIHIKNNGSNGPQRIDKTSEYSWLGKMGLEISQKVGAEILSVDFIIERSTNIPYCIDINLGHAFSGVPNSAIRLLSYFAKRVDDQPDIFIKQVSVPV
jgi:hypothetical protein